MNDRVVLLPGASGQIGIFAIPILVAAQYRVVALSRHRKPDWYPELNGVEWNHPESLASSTLDAARYLVSCGPLGVAVSLAGRCPGLERLIAFSTSSVFSKQDSADRVERAQIERIVADEMALTNQCSTSNIALSLLRPTLVYGCGMDSNISLLARWIKRFGFVPIAKNAHGLRQPVHAHDLAQTTVTLLDNKSGLSLDTPLCGGSTLSYIEMVSRIFTALGRPPRLLRMPAHLLETLTSLARVVPGLRGIRPEMVRRQARDLVFDDSAARMNLNYSPRPFAPVREDFQLPTQAYLRKLASGKRGS